MNEALNNLISKANKAKELADRMEVLEGYDVDCQKCQIKVKSQSDVFHVGSVTPRFPDSPLVLEMLEAGRQALLSKCRLELEALLKDDKVVCRDIYSTTLSGPDTITTNEA